MTIKLSELINQAVRDNTDAPRNYIGASSIGHSCLRKIWYQYKGFESSPGPRTQITFDIGKSLERLIFNYLKISSLRDDTQMSISGPSSMNNFLNVECEQLKEFNGHLDALLIYQNWSVILEIKTAKDSSFNRFKNHGLRKWNEQYYAQLQAYMGMSGIHKAVLLALNKDNSELHEEWVQYDSFYYQDLVSKAQYIEQQEEAPDRINKSPLFITCKMCQFKELCHG